MPQRSFFYAPETLLLKKGKAYNDYMDLSLAVPIILVKYMLLLSCCCTHS